MGKKLFFSFFLNLGFVLTFLTSQAQAKPLQLALNWKPEPQFGGFYAAEVEGIFKKKGLDLKITPGGSGTPTVQIVAAGQAEFGIVASEEVLLSRSHGTDVVALFAVFQTNPQSLMAHQEKHYKSIQEIFQGDGTLAVQRGLPYYSFLEKKLGKPKAKIVPYLGGISHFMSDVNYSQQGIATSEPLLAQKKGAKVSNFLIADEGFNPYMTVLVARKSFIEKNEELVKKVVAAVREGWRVYLDHPEKTNKWVHQLNPSMDDSTLKESAEAQKPLIETKETKKLGLGAMTQDRWRALATQLKEMGMIREIPEVSDLFRNL